MGINTGLPKRVAYAAYDTENNVFVSADQSNHTITLVKDGVSAPSTNTPVAAGNGSYILDLTAVEQLGLDLVVNGVSTTPNIIIVPIHYVADARWNELLEDDGGGELRGTAKFLEQAPIADVANLALEASVQTIISTGGPGPWTTGGGAAGDKDWTDEERSQIRQRIGIDGIATNPDPGSVPTLSLQETSDLILATGGDGPWTTFGGAGVLDVNVAYWQGIEIDGTNMIEDHSGIPKWTRPALENAPAGDGSVTYVSLPTTSIAGYLELLRGDTLDYNETLNVSLSFVTEIWYTIKRDENDLDSEALLQISMTGGLLVSNGEPAATSADGSISIDAERSGVIRVQCIADRMAELPRILRGAVLDVQLKSEGNIWTVFKRRVSILGDVSRVT